MAQFLIEEAALLRLELAEQAAERRALEEEEREEPTARSLARARKIFGDDA